MGAVSTPEGEAPVLVLDISAGGARLQMDVPPVPSADYQLYFTAHQTSYDPKFRVVHWGGGEGAYQWGCSFFELPLDVSDSLRRTVRAAVGKAEMSVRHWAEIRADASQQPMAEVVVGCTPSGCDICLPGQDCLEIGPDGVDLFRPHGSRAGERLARPTN